MGFKLVCSPLAPQTCVREHDMSVASAGLRDQKKIRMTQYNCRSWDPLRLTVRRLPEGSPLPFVRSCL